MVNLLRVMDMFIVIVILVSWIYINTNVKTYQIVHFKYVQLLHANYASIQQFRSGIIKFLREC